ncbi:SDR family oxidoreductase [Microbaculum marinisediminis]|uniref:SDR family oxidoreductase n=1 Tax=Microbaculum marinisediminis TaxID=2931392 RepID=A0AAW5R607_9HYPH|nr:SDR family oxidoreductase [Microbaculum sp. A6E488]MCT8974532.1 SDR family oxidoreductase [Microbaculum sp. A6E488]
MTDRSILITGCSSGIGAHCAERLRETGWRVFAAARKPADVDRLLSAGFEAVRLDYADEASIHAAADAVLAATGHRLDALFNNGAYAQAGAVEDLPTDVLRAEFEANFFGWHTLTRRLIPVMREQGHGRIVQCSSVLGYIPMKYRGAYIASKYALEGLSETMRLELLGTGIHVSLIEPGPIDSRFEPNALEVFRRTIDIDGSIHRETYRTRMARMERGGSASRFKRGPEAVFVKLRHALDAPAPRPRYRVTVPAGVAAGLRRALPTRALHAFLARASDAEK